MFKIGDRVKWVKDVPVSDFLEVDKVYEVWHVNEAQDLVFKGMEGLAFAGSRFTTISGSLDC